VTHPDPVPAAAQSATEDEEFRKIEPVLTGSDARQETERGSRDGA
jgi:hypothetical protein